MKKSLINLKTLVKIKLPDAKEIQISKQQSNQNDQNKANKNDKNQPKKQKSPTNSKNKANNNLNKSTTSTSNVNKVGLQDDSNYTIFSSKDPSGSLVCSNKPISGKLINNSFITEKDLYEFSYSLIKDSNILLFDRVYNENIKIDQFFSDQLKVNVSNLFQGQNTLFILFGPNESGKSYTLRGAETNQEKGLLNKTVLEILNLIEINKQANSGDVKKYFTFGLKISCYQVFNDIIHDLLNKDYQKELKLKGNSENCYVEGLTKKEITSQKDLDLALKEVIQLRKLLTQYLKVNDMKRKSSLVFNLMVEKREKQEGNKQEESKTTFFSQLDFVELPSSNYGLPPETEKGDIFKNISKTFNSIVNNIVSLSNGKLAKLESKLSLSLKNTLRPGSSIFFTTCCSGVETPLGDSFQALKFSNWMRNQVLNLNPNPELPINYDKDLKGSMLNDLNNINFTIEDPENNETKFTNNNEYHQEEIDSNSEGVIYLSDKYRQKSQFLNQYSNEEQSLGSGRPGYN